MADLKGTQTHENLKEAFAGESQANRRYLYFAQKADVEGYPDVAALFRSVAEGETGHAFGHFDFLAEVGDPVTDVAVGSTEDNLVIAPPAGEARARGARMAFVDEAAGHCARSGVHVLIVAPDREVGAAVVQLQRQVADRMGESETDDGARRRNSSR